MSMSQELNLMNIKLHENNKNEKENQDYKQLFVSLMNQFEGYVLKVNRLQLKFMNNISNKDKKYSNIVTMYNQLCDVVKSQDSKIKQLLKIINQKKKTI